MTQNRTPVLSNSPSKPVNFCSDTAGELPLPASEGDKKGGQGSRQVLLTGKLTAENSGEISEPTGKVFKFRVRFAPNSNPDNIQRDMILARSEAEVRDIYASTDCEVLDCVDVELQEQVELARQIADDCREQMQEFKGCVVWARTNATDALHFMKNEAVDSESTPKWIKEAEAEAAEWKSHQDTIDDLRSIGHPF